MNDSNNSDNRQLLEERDREIGILKVSIESAAKDRNEYRNLLIDVCSAFGLTDFIDLRNRLSTNTLIASGNGDHDREIHELRSQNMAANQALNDIAFQLGFQSFDNEQVAIAIEQLKSSLVDPSADSNAIDDFKANYDRDRKIEILEDNLDRARSEHLEQLRAIVQMLQVLKFDLNVLGYDHSVGALLLMIAVIQNNIVKLDPCLSSHDDA